MEKSHYYETFLKDQELDLGRYERAAKKAHEVLNINWKYEDFDKELRMAEIQTSFECAVSLGVIAAVFSLPISVIFLLSGSDITSFFAFLLPLFVFASFVYYPKYLARIRRMQLLGQSPLAIMYLVIAMEVTPNLESSVAFTAANLPDPLGRVFKRLLWEVETRNKPDMQEALSDYSLEAKEWSSHFSEAIYLVASSMRETGDKKRRTLEKSVSVVLDGTKGVMEGFARGLGTPVMIANAFGVMLPVLLLVMAPIISIFASSGNFGPPMFIIYDFVLPLVLALTVVYILGKRPSNLSEITYSKTKYRLRLFGKSYNVWPLMLLSALLFGAIQLLWFMSDPYIIIPMVHSDTSPAVSTLPGIIAIGLPIGLYLLSWAQENIETKKRVEVLEKEFASGLYQLGSVMSEGVPIEEAIEDVAGRMKGTEVELFFHAASTRVRRLGWPLEKSLFDEQHGAMLSFPSNLIKNIMLILLKSAEKGPYSASSTAINVSRYLKNMQDVKDKITDMMSDSVSGLKFQGMFLIPLVTGTIVGLGEITSNILMQIVRQVSSLVGGEMVGYSYVSQFINVEGIIQPSFLQLIIGIYILLTMTILGTFVGGLLDGWDKMTIYANIGNMLTVGVVVYAITTVCVAMIFGGMASSVVW
ncbi:MAG: hypothetical protein GOU99_00890 [Candidatus Altiarchaeota archaeon]|nr:hypothetical protein [Candidatus Altiarchaeota archaeon]